MLKQILFILFLTGFVVVANSQSNLSLVGQLSYGATELSDIWGHVDGSGKEYAIVGKFDGTSIVDISTPTNPVEVFLSNGPQSIWRDLKVWNNHAYIVNETSGGLKIIDMTSLPGLIVPGDVYQFSGVTYPFNSAHDLYIDENGFAYIMGADNGVGGAIILDLNNNPKVPIEVGRYNDFYLHDGMVRGDTLWGGAVNDGFLTVIDVTNKALPVTMATQTTPSNFTHNCWISDDGQTLFTTDEKPNAFIAAYDVSNINNIQEIDRIQSSPGKDVIPHNVFVLGDYLVTSYYRDGITIHDASNPSVMVQVGNYDTSPAFTGNGFNGAWGVYPYLPSGNIIVSDIDSGLYILKDNTKASSDDVISFTESEINVEQGTSLTVPVQRVNSSNAPQVAKVHYQVLSGSATQDVDYVLNDGELIWAANDNTPKNINLLINPDLTNEEAPETFFIRLYNPENNLTLGNHHYIKVNIAGVIDRGLANFETNSLLVSESQNTFTVNVNRLGSTAGDVSFNYHIVANEAQIGTDIEDSSGSIAWTNGESDPIPLTFTIINDNEPEANETFNITLSSVDNSKIGTNNSIVVTIADDDNNTAPTVTINENFEVNTRQSVTLTAQASDAENDEMTYLWTQTSGGSVVLSNASDLTTTFTAPSAAETLTFDFTATDFRGATSTSSVTVTVVAPPEVIVVTPPKSNNDGGGGSFGYAIFSLFLLLAFRQKNRV